MKIMKTKPAILVAALLCASCATELKTRPPKDFVWHTVTAQEDLGMIALRYYDNPKAGFIYLQEVNWDRLARDQPAPAEPAPGTRIQVPSKAEFQQWCREGAKSRIPSLDQTVEPAADLSSSAHWGWIYQRGMEHGPASKEHSVALGKAEAFLAKQPFAAQFAKRAFMVDGADPIEVSFIAPSIPGGETRGVVRVNPSNGECSWLGVKDAASRTRIVVTLPANGVVAATPQQQTFLERLESLWLHASREEVQILLGKATQATATNLFYHLNEDRTTGGYYVGATLTFTAQGLEQVHVHSGHETRSEPRHK